MDIHLDQCYYQNIPENILAAFMKNDPISSIIQTTQNPMDKKKKKPSWKMHIMMDHPQDFLTFQPINVQDSLLTPTMYYT